MEQYTKTKQINSVKKKKKSGSERKKLVKQLDQEVRRIVNARDTHCCHCLKPVEDGQVSHYISRRVYALRWNLRNCHLAHAGCNLRHNFDPEPYSSFLIKKYSKGILEEFSELKNQYSKVTTVQLRGILEELQKL